MPPSEQAQIRRESLQKLRELGIDPYPASEYETDTNTQAIRAHYREGKRVSLAGRMMSRRIMGKASFAELKDATGRIQLYVSRESISNDEAHTAYNTVFKKLLDIGDIIGVVGSLFKTRVGEISVHVTRLTLLSKSLRPPPVVKTDATGTVFDAFSAAEQRYRMRYVDLIVNDGVKEIFIKRSRLISSMRKALDEAGYLEVETPILQPIPGGAAARPFVTHHNALDMSLYLRIADELYLKRLIVGGFEGVYEFAKDFRNEGMDRTHNPEFTMMELYVAYKDYSWMMQLTEQLLERVAIAVNGSTDLAVGGHQIRLQAPFKRIGILDSIQAHTGLDLYGKGQSEIRGAATDLGIEVDPNMGVGKLIDKIFEEKCERHYIQPTFITDYPIAMSPLTKRHREKAGLTERFELLINGSEIANAYSELNDPIDQRERFEAQLKQSEKAKGEALSIDWDFLRALEYGMPPTAGIGIGIDRLVMLLTNADSIQEVLFFPQMRPERETEV